MSETHEGPSPLPSDPASLDNWAKRHGLPRHEARERYAAWAILQSIAASRRGRAAIAFKGGNALRFVYGNLRSTRDLDFTRLKDLDDKQEAVSDLFQQTLAGIESRSGIRAICQSVQRRPPGQGKTHPTYLVRIGYQFPGDRLYMNLPKLPHVPTTVPVEVSFNDIVCETIQAQERQVDLGGLTVCSLNDIVAEKLRALLQQVVRKRRREQDVYDIAAVLSNDQMAKELRPADIARFLTEKCECRGLLASRQAFRDPEVRNRAAADYDRTIQSQAGAAFISFKDAWSQVEALLDRLPLPN